ncbi:MAG: hypothetical protein JSU72_16040 [Deltaproteobacteria bacterium]|nr:MAG: hypothetical protein JSU72_16040 [Deltaproteobacteria bacterium]
MTNNNDAVAFLSKYGHKSLVNLGAGCMLNRIDNHLRLMKELSLTYYVGIDCAPYIKLTSPNIFSDPPGMTELLTGYYQGQPEKLWEAVKVFPGTWVEELKDMHCAVVVCQRVYPDCRWEEVILSMTPKLVLQEDLHGCERQQLRGRGYVRTWTEIRRYGLQPFRPWPIFPWERNLILWRRRDFGDEEVRNSRWRLFWRLCEWFIG